MPTSLRPPGQKVLVTEPHSVFPIREIIVSAGRALRMQLMLGQKDPSSKLRWTVEQCGTYRTALKEYRRRLCRLTKTRVDRSREGQRNAAEHALKSFDGRFVATVRVASHRNRLISFEKAVAYAESTSLERPCDEPVVVGTKVRGGKQRLIVAPGARRRATQIVLRDTLIAGDVGNPYEFSQKKLGPFAACAAIEGAIRNGYVHWLVFDIKDFFSSVKPEHLSWIPVRSHQLLNGAYIPAEARILRGPSLTNNITQDHINKAARLGLPLGSMVSPKIASAFLGRILQELPGDLARVSYMDDGALGARSYGEIKTIEKTLSDRLASLPAGPLTLKFAEIYHAFDGIQFMQFRVKQDLTDANRAVVSPSRTAFMRFQAEVRRRWGDGASEVQLNEFAIRWAQTNQWLGRAADAVHEEAIRDFLSISVDEAIGW